MEERFAPYLDRESAIEWLRRHLAGNGVDVRTMYHLEIINKLIQNGKEIFERIPPQTFGGLPEGGRRNVQAAALCRADEAAGGGPSGGSGEEERKERLETLLAAWSKRDGSWFPAPEKTLEDAGGVFIGNGSEADVFRKDDATVVKVLGTVYFGNPQEALDRITLHNALFPETAMTLEGFGRNRFGDLAFIVTQPYIEGGTASPGDLGKMVSDLGMSRIESLISGTEYCNPEIYLGDLHDENVLLSPGGNLFVIDCDARLNTPELGYGGSYQIPDVSFTEESVAAIDSILEEMTPKRCPRERFETAFFTQDDSVQEQLTLTGRYDGVFRMRNRNGEDILVAAQLDPDDPEDVIYSDSRNISKMLDGVEGFSRKELDEMAFGKGVWKGDTFHAFNLAKGRIDTAVSFEQKLKEDLARDEAMRNRKTTGRQSISDDTTLPYGVKG